MFLEKAISQGVDVASADPVTPIRIFHEVELFVEFDQPVQQSLGSLKMNIVISRAVNDQQLPFQTAGMCDR